MFYTKHHEFLKLCKVDIQGDFLYIFQLDLERAKHPYLAIPIYQVVGLFS